MCSYSRLPCAPQDVVRRKIPGDLIETGVYRGGTTVFMKACLRALGAEDRNVWVCDTFQPQGEEAGAVANFVFLPIARLLASIPGRAYRRAFFEMVQRVSAASKMASFPLCEDADDTPRTFAHIFRRASALDLHVLWLYLRSGALTTV